MIRPSPHLFRPAALLLLAGAALAQSLPFDEKFVLAGALVDDHAGTALAGFGDRLVVGGHQVHGSAPALDGPGRAVVYVWQGASWVPEAQWDGFADSSGFGDAVAMDADRVVVGAPEFAWPAGTGRAFVYHRVGSTWGFESELVAPGLVDGDGFGRAVAIQGDRAVVGAPDGDGGAYLFERGDQGWQFVVKLLPEWGPDPAAQIGCAVAVAGDVVAVGASGFDWQGYDSGTVWLFEPGPTGWQETQWLLASGGATVTYVGTSVALEDDTLVVGSQDEAAYVFRRSAGDWSEVAKLEASDAPGFSGFGRAVALAGARVAVGAPWRDGPGGQSGAVYLFSGGGAVYAETAIVTAADGANWDELGTAVALSGGQLWAGSPGDDGDTGAAYRLALPAVATWADLGAALAGAFGAPELTGVGTGLAGEPSALSLANAAPGAPAWLAFGSTALSLPLLGGFLVPNPVTGGLVALGTDGSGAVELPFILPGGLPPGATLLTQFWILDASGPQGVTASNALALQGN